VAAARALGSLLSAGLTSRRGRDATIVLASLFFIAVQGVRFIHFADIDPALLDRVSDWLRWLPPGMLGQAVIDAGHGRTGLALLELIPALVAVPLLLRAWSWSLERAVTVVTDGSTSPRRRRDTSLPLMFARLPFLPPGPWGAVAAKELRYAVRHPRLKVSTLTNVIVGVGLPLWLSFQSSGRGGPPSVLLATLGGYIVLLGAINQYGVDGGALWLDVVAGDRVAAELIGKNVALVIRVLPVVAVVGVIIAATKGGWLYLPAALVLSGAGLGAGLASGNVASVRFPVRLPDNNNPFAGNAGGEGCASGVVIALCVIVQNILLAPVVIAAAVAAAVAPIALVVVAPASAVYGGLLWWGGLVSASKWARTHQPELIRAVDPVRSD
jgi:ABC-2 type transport system permease protein